MTAIVVARTVHAGAGAHTTAVTRTHSVTGFIFVHHGLLFGRETLVKQFTGRSDLLEHVSTNFHVLGAETHGFFTIGRALAVAGFVPGKVLAGDFLTAGDVLVERLLGGTGKIHGLSEFGVIGAHLLNARGICRGRSGIRSGESHSGKTGDCCKGNCCKGSLHFHNQPLTCLIRLRHLLSGSAVSVKQLFFSCVIRRAFCFLARLFS